jgi:hypothetical protein
MIIYNKMSMLPDDFKWMYRYTENDLLIGYVADEEDVQRYQAASRPPPDHVSRWWKGHDEIRFRAADTRSEPAKHGFALQAAAYYGQELMVDLLLSHGADVNIYAGYFGTALQAAAASGYMNVVQKLVAQGAHVNTISGFHGNSLTAAASGGHLEVCEYLVHEGARINARGGEYGFALSAAARSGNVDLVRLLLDAGAQPNSRGGAMPSKLLYWASKMQHSSRVQTIMQFHEFESASSPMTWRITSKLRRIPPCFRISGQLAFLVRCCSGRQEARLVMCSRTSHPNTAAMRSE